MRRGLCPIDKDRFVPNYTTSASQPPLRARSVNIHGFNRVGGMVTSTLCRPILVRPTAAALRLVLVPCLFCLKFGIKKKCFEVHSRTLNILHYLKNKKHCQFHSKSNEIGEHTKKLILCISETLYSF